jgi:lysophospholipase L1-like esterase
VRRYVVSGVLGGVLLLAAPLPAVAAKRSLPRVTLISDSVAASIAFDVGAKAILADGIDLFLEPGEGRRLGGDTPAGGIAPPTALQLVQTLGRRLGRTVIMCVGYNDVSSQYAGNMEVALDELRAAGVTHVLWVTLHVSPEHTGNATMNAAIAAAAAQHQEVTIVDWNAFAAGHPEWFQPDGTHLRGDAPRAMARLFHASLVKLGIPVSRGS